MTEYFKMSCPLCGEEAKYCLANHDDRKYFRCPQCTDFQLTDGGERCLDCTAKSWRENVSKQAKDSEYESVLIIDMIEVSLLSPGETPYPVTSFYPRSKIPQCS